MGNVIDVDAFNIPLPKSPRLQVGMISSNLPKKGLNDFVQLAALLHEQGVDADCVLVGPNNDHIETMLAKHALPPNLRLAGYAASPQVAMAQLDVLLNLSHCQESFGRTVLEAMAAARPVVCYEWGALPELVVHGHTGLLAPFADVARVAEHVTTLAKNSALRHRLGQAGRARAVQYYSPHVMQQTLARLLHELVA